MKAQTTATVWEAIYIGTKKTKNHSNREEYFSTLSRERPVCAFAFAFVDSLSEQRTF